MKFTKRKKVYFASILVVIIIAFILIIASNEHRNMKINNYQEAQQQYIIKNIEQDICSFDNVVNAVVDLQYNGERYAAVINIEMEKEQMLSEKELISIKQLLVRVLKDISDENITININN